jgi:hypothetical protein
MAQFDRRRRELMTDGLPGNEAIHQGGGGDSRRLFYKSSYTYLVVGKSPSCPAQVKPAYFSRMV